MPARASSAAVNAVPRRVGKGDAFPMRKFADARLPKRGAIHARDVDRVARLLRIELHQTRGRQRGRERAVGRVIPAARANAGGVAKTALHFVGQRDRGDQLATIRAHAFGDRERRGDVVARMRRFFRKIGVVVIEIANATAGRERRPVRRRLMIGADDGRAVSWPKNPTRLCARSRTALRSRRRARSRTNRSRAASLRARLPCERSSKLKRTGVFGETMSE